MLTGCFPLPLPSFATLAGGNQLDSMTQDWLTRELAYESVFDEQVSSAATPTTWPHVREADGTQAQSDRINQLRSWDFDVWQYDEEVSTASHACLG